MKYQYAQLFENLGKENLLLISQKKWLTTGEVAFYLGTSEGAVRNLVYRGVLRPKSFGGRGYRNLFKREELDRIIEASD
jgi:excisionase family DNA binding protein